MSEVQGKDVGARLTGDETLGPLEMQPTASVEKQLFSGFVKDHPALLEVGLESDLSVPIDVGLSNPLRPLLAIH